LTANLKSLQLEFTIRETALVEGETHNCESLTERLKECHPYIEEVGAAACPFNLFRDREQL
jgi:hypothetical protein